MRTVIHALLALLLAVALAGAAQADLLHAVSTCGRCGGSGKCWVCSGSGTSTAGATCSMCNGSGKCYFCGGKGEL